MEEPDSDLFRRARSGDRDAFGQLLEAAGCDLAKALRSRVPARLKSKVDVDDVVQSAYKETLERGPRLELVHPTAFRRYVEVVAERRLNRALRYFATNKRSVDREQKFDATADDSSIPSPGARLALERRGPATEAEVDEQRLRIRDAVENLPEPLRTVALLEMDEMTSPEIAKILERPESTVRTWRSQVRSRLHTALRANPPTPARRSRPSSDHTMDPGQD